MSSKIKRLAVFTSGGDAPGMNAAIRAVVRTCIFNNIIPFGIYRGYEGMIENDIVELDARSVAHILQKGGTILKSARCEEFKTKEGMQLAYENLKKLRIDAFVAIGGDGTFTGAHRFFEEYDYPVIGIPGTIDNDLFGTDNTLGFDTAVNTVIRAIDKIRDTAMSHNRLFFVEVMGRDSGFIATHAAVGSGAVAVMVPERKMSIQQLIEKLETGRKVGKSSSIVIVAEGGKSGNAYEIAKEVSKEYKNYETKVTVLGHIQRGGSPTADDRILASRFGVAAVESLINGNSDVMIGIVNNKITLTPLAEAITDKLPLNEEIIRISNILSI